MKNVSGAAAAWKRACELLGEINLDDGERRFTVACWHAGVAAITELPGSRISAGEGLDQAKKATTVLRQAVARGYRIPDDYKTESALDPLCTRPDFKLLMMDIVFPANPFAPRRERISTGKRVLGEGHVHDQKLEVAARSDRVEIAIVGQKRQDVKTGGDGAPEVLHRCVGRNPGRLGRDLSPGFARKPGEPRVKARQVVIIVGSGDSEGWRGARFPSGTRRPRRQTACLTASKHR